MKLIVWVKLCVMRTGRTFVHWPARDVREDILIVDTSRFDQNLVGVRRRTYNTLGLYRKKLPPPDYPNEIETAPSVDMTSPPTSVACVPNVARRWR